MFAVCKLYIQACHAYFSLRVVCAHRLLCTDVHRKTASCVFFSTHPCAYWCSVSDSIARREMGEDTEHHHGLCHCQASFPRPVHGQGVGGGDGRTVLLAAWTGAATPWAVVLPRRLLCVGGFFSFRLLISTKPARAPPRRGSLRASATYLEHAVSFSSQSTRPE